LDDGKPTLAGVLMHTEVMEWVHKHTFGTTWGDVLDIGGLDVNGSPKHIVKHGTWTSLDLVDESVPLPPLPSSRENVNIIADAATWHPVQRYDLVLCLEVLEHAQRWKDIIRTCALATRRNTGWCVITCATDPRPVHDAYGFDGPPPEGQYYGNVDPVEFESVLEAMFAKTHVNVLPQGDLQAVATRSLLV